LKADVLLAPHHGSGTSSTIEFLQAVHPSVALFQVGYRNRYRHPKQEIVQRYRDHGILPLRTDQSGAIRMEVDADIRWTTHRCQRQRYWSSEPCLLKQ
jgi:competence protein ComEC